MWKKRIFQVLTALAVGCSSSLLLFGVFSGNDGHDHFFDQKYSATIAFLNPLPKFARAEMVGYAEVAASPSDSCPADSSYDAMTAALQGELNDSDATAAATVAGPYDGPYDPPVSIHDESSDSHS